MVPNLDRSTLRGIVPIFLYLGGLGLVEQTYIHTYIQKPLYGLKPL